MLADRPDMSGVLDEDDLVFQWVVEGFNGDRFGQRVYWNADFPQVGSDAFHFPPYYGYPAFISLSNRTHMTPVDRWVGVVYELHNLDNTQAFEKLYNRAIAEEIDGDTYAVECLRLEFAATKRTKEFFSKHSLPASKHGNDAWYNWLSGDIGTFDEYVAAFQEKRFLPSFDPLKYWRDSYDTRIAPYIEWSRLSDANAQKEK